MPGQIEGWKDKWKDGRTDRLYLIGPIQLKDFRCQKFSQN